jgi:hypothetical protein
MGINVNIIKFFFLKKKEALIEMKKIRKKWLTQPA